MQPFDPDLTYGYLESPVGRLLLAGDAKRLHLIAFPTERNTGLVQKTWRRDDTAFTEAFRQFAEEDPAKGYAVLMVLAKELCHRLRHNSDSMLRREETRGTHVRSDFPDTDPAWLKKQSIALSANRDLIVGDVPVAADQAA